MSRTVIETVPVKMTYDEYKVFEAVARQSKMSVPDAILRLATVGAHQWMAELLGER